jgi:2-polyprenyl-3-methyl-5-hydroxy-6-metoxy-1,4-benzoquinol methylase
MTMDASGEDRQAEFAERLIQATNGALDVAAAYFGIRLGFYESLAAEGPATAIDLAKRTDTNERMVREWLEQQTATGVLEATGEGDDWRFKLPAEHAVILIDPAAQDGMAGTIRQLIAEVGMAPRLLETFRTGRGVPYADYGPDEAEGQALSSRPLYQSEMATWLAALPDLHDRLADEGGRVLDIGCGLGWSSVSIARALPTVTVLGVDLDEASIDAARPIAARAGLSDRVQFEVKDAAELAGEGYDLATMFEMLHDLARPVEALRAARNAVGADGTVLVADELVGDEFTGRLNPAEGRHYGWSLLHCLPASLAEPDSAATGTVIRPATVRAYAERAGFSRVDVLPVETATLRLYALRP